MPPDVMWRGCHSRYGACRTQVAGGVSGSIRRARVAVVNRRAAHVESRVVRRRLGVLALIVVHVGLRLAVWARPVRQLDDLVLPDDAWLSLHLARSIAHGLGPRYGLAPTNGFQPLYVFLMAPVFAWTGGDPLVPVKAALLLLIAADALAMVLTLRFARRLGCSDASLFLAGLVWALGSFSLTMSLDGLETSLAAAAIAATLLQWQRVREAGADARRWLALGVLVGLAYLARIDALLVVPALAVPLAFDPAGRAGGVRAWALAAGAALLVALPWLAFSAHWTHTLLPVSGRALRYMNLSNVNHAPTWSNLYAPMLARGVREVVRQLGLPIGLAALLALATQLASRGDARPLARLRALAPLAAFAALLFAAYTLVVFGPWYFARYFYPMLIPAALAVALTADALLRASGPRRRAVAWALAVVVVGVSAADPRTRALLTPGEPGAWGYRRIGVWARDHFPAGAVLGGSQTGALGYFADRQTVVNLDGVVNRDALEAMRAKRMLPYIRATGIQYLVWQDDIAMIARETRGDASASITDLGAVPGITTRGWPWHVYLVDATAGRAAQRP